MTRLLSLFCLCLFTTPVLAVKLVVLDVGEGQAVLLQDGREGVLFDTGHAGKAKHVIQRLQHHGVEHLKAIILTHLHPDHASGYFRLREAFPHGIVVDSGHPLPKLVTPDISRWVRDALRSDTNYRMLRQGDALSLGTARVRFLWPKEFQNYNLNLHSLVTLIEVGQNRILIMGDATKPVERVLLKQQVVPKQIELLVVGHHGAADSGTVDFLKLLQPRLSVISVDKDNIRGYPHKNTLAALKKYSGRLLRTDLNGEICLQISQQVEGSQACH